MHLKESRDQKLPLWAYTHVLGMLRKQNRGVAGVGRGTLFLYLSLACCVSDPYSLHRPNPAIGIVGGERGGGLADCYDAEIYF
jgi:hypothetical protein